MSLVLVQRGISSGDRACPELWEVGDPVYCHECGKAWDYSAERDCFARSEEGELYCTEKIGWGESCFRISERRSFREQLRSRLGRKLKEVEELLDEIHGEHAGYFRGEETDPASDLEELIALVEAL